MVIVDCPWCLGPVALNDDEASLTCEGCAIVHAHRPASMALTMTGERPDPAALPETAFFLPRLPLVAFGEMGSTELAGRVAVALSEGEPVAGAVLLERHGAIAVGTGGDPDDARTALAQAIDRIE